MNNDSSHGGALPRAELREAAFRIYEGDMKMACRGTYNVSAEDIALSSGPRLRSARTYKLRFRDAMLGFERYSYTSSIPYDYPISCLDPIEMADGTVTIYNRHADDIKKAKVIHGHKRSIVFVALYIASRDFNESNPGIPIPLFLFHSAGDVEYFKTICARFNVPYSPAGNDMMTVQCRPLVPDSVLIDI